ncbi:hypothetical protein EEL36_07770 [Muribaculaceae bacterium Isolate-043 (Harlan)]|nr:hypothetical protein EEL36_07770 [Muribaculaceae bacterium Isolate-043 (Harlan)]
MAKRKYIDYKKQQAELFKRTESYAANVGAAYRSALTEIINLVKGTELEAGKPFSFAEYGYSDEVTPILRSMYSRVYQIIRGGVEKEWLNANEHNDGLVKAIFGEHSIEDNHFARFFQRNMDAMNAFFARKTGTGLNLSQKVWKYTGIYKDELEDALDLAIGEGTPANRLATQIQKYLNDPDRFYRRFRVKIGENEDGTPKYGRIWKRRVYDAESESYKWIDDDPRKYHPGRGVYRSSYRNAQRLARTETNIAYRTADYERWQQMPFVIGIEIKLSNNHPEPDICDDLKGIYPKNFKWTGWHPNCRCYQEPVLSSPAELDKMLDNILDGADPASVDCAGEVTAPPPTFKAWVKDNEERMEKAVAAGTLPYFVKDNQSTIQKILHGLTPEQQAARTMGDLLDDPMGLLAQHGMDSLKQLYSAVQSKLGQMLNGSLEHQADTLKFEIDWVTKQKKYPTWEGAANAYKKALNKVELQMRRERMAADIQGVEAFVASNSVDKVNALFPQLKAAYDAGDVDTALRLLSEAQKAIEEYKAELMKQGLNSTTKLEKYCDKHRTFDSKVKSDKTFVPFQDRMITDSSPAWQAATDEAKKAVSAYTNGTYDTINRSYWQHKRTHADGTLMDSILDGCALSKDTVLRRGCDMAEMGSIFGDEFLRMVRACDIDGLNAVAGCRGINEGFISTSFDMSGGFWKSVDLRIYAPKGTQALYAKPISGYGDRHGAGWDGSTASRIFDKGRENEVIVHRGYEYRFIKAEAGGKKGSSITIYVELLSRDKRLVK